MMYQALNNQSAKLGSWEGPGMGQYNQLGTGGADSATAVVGIIGQTVSNVTQFVTGSQTARAGFRAQRDIAHVTQSETTKRLDITGRTSTESARIDVDRVGAQYGGITKIILVSGIALTGLLIAGGFAYGLTKK